MRRRFNRKITGTTQATGEHKVTFRATNGTRRGDERLPHVIDDTIALTPPMGAAASVETGGAGVATKGRVTYEDTRPGRGTQA